MNEPEIGERVTLTVFVPALDPGLRRVSEEPGARYVFLDHVLEYAKKGVREKFPSAEVRTLPRGQLPP